MAAVLELTSGFDFGATVIIDMWIGIGLQILSELDDRMELWRHVDLQDDGNCVANLLSVSVLVMYHI